MAVHRSIVTTRGVSGVVESLCKIRPETRFGANLTQLPEDVMGQGSVGMWEEGLAFYGWLFYLSKFYEVIDTAIIIAKGKKSSLLQTYHHAGAMICMWAGIRYVYTGNLYFRSFLICIIVLCLLLSGSSAFSTLLSTLLWCLLSLPPHHS